MAVHAAFGGSTNLLLHIPAIAFAAGLRAADGRGLARGQPSASRGWSSVLPNGPIYHPTVRVFLAGGVPEVMLHLRELGLLDTRRPDRHRRAARRGPRLVGAERAADELRERLLEQDGVDPDDVIMSPDRARERGLTSTVTFPRGNLAPEGSVIKSTAIDPTRRRRRRRLSQDRPGPRLHPRARRDRRDQGAGRRTRSRPGDVLVLIGRGPMGAGMEEIYQITSALKHLSFGKQVAVVTDARFSGVSTGACIGHVGPEALAGGPIGKVRDGDLDPDRRRPRPPRRDARPGRRRTAATTAPRGSRILAERPPHPDLSPDPDLPDDTRLWAALQAVGGGTWGGCVYDTDAIIAALQLARERRPAGEAVAR